VIDGREEGQFDSPDQLTPLAI